MFIWSFLFILKLLLFLFYRVFFFFFFKQKTAYEVRISDWSSDVCSSDLRIGQRRLASGFDEVVEILPMPQVTPVPGSQPWMLGVANIRGNLLPTVDLKQFLEGERTVLHESQRVLIVRQPGGDVAATIDELFGQRSFLEEQALARSEEHTSELQSLMRSSYAVFCLKKK